MDWVSILVTLATAAFLLPILKDFQTKSAELTRKTLDLQTQLRMAEETNEKDKAEEARVSSELKEMEKELAGVEKEHRALVKAAEAIKQKRG